MVNEAEKFKDEDSKQRERIEQRNALDGYMFSVKQSLNDENLKDKWSSEDKELIQTKVNEVQEWYDSNNEASKEDYEQKQKELENIFTPIMTKMSQPDQQPDVPQSDEPESQEPEMDEPKIEEID